MSTYSKKEGQFDSSRWIRDFKNKAINEGPENDPALKSLRIKSKGEMMPTLSQWWEYDPDDIMRFVYWGKGMLPPSDPKTREKEFANLVKQLHVKYPIPADAEGHLDMSTIGEGAAEYSFQAGDMWSEDFDYVGMLTAGSEATYEMGLEHLQKLYDSFEDVNYHTEKADLGNAIEWMEDPGQDANQAQERIEDFLEMFRAACLKTLKEITRR